MAVASTHARPDSVDRSTGRLKLLTDETDTDEVWRDVLHGIDESRPHCLEIEDGTVKDAEGAVVRA